MTEEHCRLLRNVILSKPPQGEDLKHWNRTMLRHQGEWYPKGNKLIVQVTDCPHLKTKMATWTHDNSGSGYCDWKNILDYDSYDGKKRKTLVKYSERGE